VKDGLLDRYPAHRRELPLQRTTDPYASRVAEVTLEQTQVARVVPRYEGERGER
jgi:adenine-specific DNA glycosylase